MYPLGHVVEVEGSNHPPARQQGGTADPPEKMCALFNHLFEQFQVPWKTPERHTCQRETRIQHIVSVPVKSIGESPAVERMLNTSDTARSTYLRHNSSLGLFGFKYCNHHDPQPCTLNHDILENLTREVKNYDLLRHSDAIFSFYAQQFSFRLCTQTERVCVCAPETLHRNPN